MKAVVVMQPGGLEQLQVAEMPAPEPGPGGVVIDVAYCGLNWADRMIRLGTYPHPFKYPVIPGLEVSGVVRSVGAGVTRVKPGDRVAGFHEKGGGYAEQCRVDQDWVIPLPDWMDFQTAAAFPVQALTAWHMLHTVGHLKPGQWVLIHAIGGGVGLNCTQLAVHAGAHVLGTVGTPGKQALPLQYGAAQVLLNGSEDFVAAALAHTGGRGVDLLIDSLGAATLDRSFDAVRKLGHIISIGEAEGLPYQNIRERLLPRSQTFTRLHVGHIDPKGQDWADGLADVMAGLHAGWLNVPVQKVYRLDQAAEMHAHIESRQLSGKLLLEVLGG
jgi:NADPH2:quinone reductase